MRNIIKLARLISGMPIYLVSRLIPSSENIWAFGSWHGNKYGDSSKILFEHVSKHHPEIRSIWITKNKRTLNLVSSKGYEVYYAFTLKGFWMMSRSGVNIFNVSFNDISKFVPAKVLINLWHGIPLKKIGYDNTVSKVIDKSNKRRLKKIFPYIRGEEYVDLAIASSDREAKQLESAFDLPPEKVFVSGLPRNDVFQQPQTNTNTKSIIYLPTWRNNGSSKLTDLLASSADNINNTLASINVVMYIKLHPNNEKDLSLKEYSNIKILSDEEIEQDIYSKINDFDIMITDYSSIYFDFLLSDNPVIFTQFDHAEYISQNRELYYDYDTVTPGPKCSDWNDAMKWVERFNCNPSEYKNERLEMKNLFHKFQDGQSCERVFQKILSVSGAKVARGCFKSKL
ncbi:CDP-glycerol glycerophosphotransferase family protein [Vibrio profundum]|uniref:CDP-glycerol glycerophosphotransferase family protein n=1 Tax=Vibrio profundum TaxID=2910247 RepID=UPI003D113FE5